MPQLVQPINSTQTDNIKSGLFGYLLILTVFFILLQISLFLQTSELYLGDYKLVADRLKIPSSVIPEISYFLFVQLFLHFLFTVMIWGMTRLIGIALHCPWKMIEKIGFSLWFLGIITLLLLNQHYFPNSKFSSLLNYLFSATVGGYLLLVCLSLIVISSFIAIWGLFLITSNNSRLILLSTIVFASAAFIVQQSKASIPIVDAATPEKPNIIFIGIDSLRPDFLGYFGYEKHTPHLDAFLNQASVFTDAFTPLARTFPAWISILTGQYPKQSGVRFNLPKLTHFNWQNTLPSILRVQGYETIFATDETRFSNIDARFGFDETITPPIGFNDFLLGNMNDFPIANLIVNTWIGKYLFPHSYGNRPVITTYDPNSFIAFLKPTLEKARTKPVFFAVHFCLPHFPYFWGNDAADDKSIHNYQAAVKRVDQQFQDFFDLLKQNKMLEHSIVVVLSDHGEAIELPGDRVTEQDLFIPGEKNKKGIIPRFYPQSFDFETVNQSGGHGTDVLGLTQYHIVLAFKMFGLTHHQNLVLTDKVSLLDIKPTVLDFLNIPHKHREDGHSLKDLILTKNAVKLPQEHFFIESDFSPQAVRSVHPETRQLLFEGIDYFQIDPVTSRVTVKNEMAHMIISSKQFADIYGEWILALYPQNKSEMMPILVNLNTGQWTNDLQTQFAKTSPAMYMLQAMKKFYGRDITRIMNDSNPIPAQAV